MLRRAGLALVLVSSLLLHGCWDRREIEDTAYVVALGIDQMDGEHLWTFHVVESATLPVGMLTTVPLQPGRQSIGLVSVRGNSLEQAVQLVQASMTRVMNLEQLRYIIFSERSARSGLGPLISQLLRHNQVRRGVSVAVSPGRAVDVLVQDRPVGEANPVRIMEGMFLVQKQLHLSPPVRLQHFYSRLLAPGADPVMPLIAVNETAKLDPGAELPAMGSRSFTAGEFPRAGGNPVENAGTAVFRRDELAGFLNVDETSALLSLRGAMGKVYASIPDPEEPGEIITLRFHQENKPQFRARFDRGGPVVEIRLQLEGEILSTEGRTDYSDPANRRVLEDFAAKHLEQTSYASMVTKVYGEWKTDPVGLGQLFRGTFATFHDWMEYNWHERVRDLKVSVDITLMIRRFGLLLENPEPS